MVEAAPVVYSSREEIEAIFSAIAVSLRADDDMDDTVNAVEEEYIDAAIEEATDQVNQYLLHRYDASALVESRWVRRKTSYIAAHILSRRRGNASQYADEVAICISELDDILKGRKFVPRIAQNDTYLPSIGNVRVNYQYPNAPLRVDFETSTGPNYPGMYADYYLGIGNWWKW